MNKLIAILIFMCGLSISVQASDGCNQRLTPEEFRARQQAYITEQAGLTEAEAESFFPIYFELQDRKKQLMDEAWALIRKGKKVELSEEEYEQIIEGVYDARIASDRLDKTYFDKFKKILPFKKIYLVLRAELNFHRGLVKGMHPTKGRKMPMDNGNKGKSRQ